MLEKNMTLDELVEIFYNNYKAYIKKSKENLSKEVQGLNILTSPNRKLRSGVVSAFLFIYLLT